MYTDRSGHVLSDHFPLFFLFHVHCSTFHALPSSSPVRPARVLHLILKTTVILVYQYLPALPVEICNCTYVNCVRHHRDLDVFSEVLESTLHSCASQCLQKVCQVKDSAAKIKKITTFWYKVWEEAGCPSSGVLSNIKRSAKRRYKYEVRRLKRRHQFVVQDRLAHSFARKRKDSSWSEVKHKATISSRASVVDGVSGSGNICNLFAARYGAVMNRYIPLLIAVLNS